MFYNGKPQSCTSDFLGMALVYAVEAFKDTFLMSEGNSNSRILYSHARLGAFMVDGDFYFTILFIIFHCVVAEIVDDLVQNLTDGSDHNRTACHFNVNSAALCCYGETFLDIGGKLKEIDLFFLVGKLPFIQLRNLDDILHQSDQPLCFHKDASRKAFHIFLFHDAVLHNLRKTRDRG